eukprot:5693733-Alexandrium_andersonii.AAC.1
MRDAAANARSGGGAQGDASSPVPNNIAHARCSLAAWAKATAGSSPLALLAPPLAAAAIATAPPLAASRTGGGRAGEERKGAQGSLTVSSTQQY